MNKQELASKWIPIWSRESGMSDEEFTTFTKDVYVNGSKPSEVLKEILDLAGIPIVGGVADLISQVEFTELLDELSKQFITYEEE